MAVRVIETLCEIAPDVAVIVTCEFVGVGLLGEGFCGVAVVIFPLLHPDIIPAKAMQATARAEPRSSADRLRIPANPSSPSGSRPASNAPRWSRRAALYPFTGGGGAVIAPVPIARLTVVGVVPETFAEAGLKVQPSPEGSPEQDSVTVPLNPFVPARLSDRLPTCPLVTVTLCVEEVNVKSAVPVGGATEIEPNRPPCSLLIPAAK